MEDGVGRQSHLRIGCAGPHFRTCKIWQHRAVSVPRCLPFLGSDPASKGTVQAVAHGHGTRGIPRTRQYQILRQDVSAGFQRAHAPDQPGLQ